MNRTKYFLRFGILLLTLFALWTFLIQTVDVRSAGETASAVGFSTLNLWFHELTGVHIILYSITDWSGLVPVFICILFGAVGAFQLITRKSLFHVDLDLILLGVYYIVVIILYLLFERIPINYRPIFIEGRLETSYPSSTTLLVLSVMPTLNFQLKHRLKASFVQYSLRIFSGSFSLFSVVCRAVSGVHWITDIIGACLLSTGLFFIYCALVLFLSTNNSGRKRNGIR